MSTIVSPSELSRTGLRIVRRVLWSGALRASAMGALAVGALAACGGGGDGSSGPAAVARVQVSVGNVILNTIGGTQAVTATPKDASGNTVAASVVWSSDNASIASVTGSGNSATITSVSPGATVIRARVGTIGADIPVQVLGVRSIQVTPANASVRAGDTQPLSTIFDADPGVPTTVTWTTDNPAIATVSPAGLVTGVAPGTAVVRATSVADTRVSATASINVTPARGVVLSPATANLATGEQRTLGVTVNIETGLSTAVTWRTSAASIATVNSTGRVTGVAFGTAIITAVSVADTTLKGTATINVVPVVRNIVVTPAAASLFIGGTQQLTSTVTAEGSLATTSTWSSSNNTVATVNASGLVTAVSVGTAIITATSTADATKTATATISITPRPISVAIVQRVVGLNPGTSTTLTGTVSADPGVSTQVGWSSGTPSVATINAAGLVTALTSGTTLITATALADPTKTDTVTVTVVPRLASAWASTRLNGILYDDLLSVIAFNPTAAFAVNSINGGASGGDIYRWNGVSWTVSTTGAAFGTQFIAVHGISQNALIAVGTNGVIARFDGTSWTAMTSGTTRELRAVWMESASSAFAVGSNGTALRMTGSTWATTATGSTAQLNGVWSNAGTAYAVGAGGEVLRYNGTAWLRQTVPFVDDLNAVTSVVGGNVTAVGSFGGILEFDGSVWTLVPSNGVLDNLYAISGSAANNGRMYIGGDNGLYQLESGTLSSSAAPYPVSVFGVSLDPSGVVWTSGQRGAVQRFTGGNWETLNFAPDLLDVWTTSASNAFAVGEYGFVYQWNGTAWAKQNTPSMANLYVVWAASGTDAFAGGDNGTMLRWNGTAWNSMSLPTTARVFALWGSSGNNVFAATDIGEILRYDGATWSTQTTAPGGATLLALYGVAANQVYAAGTGGLVMRYDGTSWSTVSAPDAVTTLYGLWLSGGNNIVSVGADQVGMVGYAFNFNGSAWQSMGLAGAKALTSVWGPSVFDLYATGDLGTLLRYNGTGWQSMPTGTSDLLWSVSGAPNALGGAFAVGINTTMVTGTPGSSLRMASSLTASSRGRLEPTAAARRDRKASGKAAVGAARRDKSRLKRSTPAVRRGRPRD